MSLGVLLSGAWESWSEFSLEPVIETCVRSLNCQLCCWVVCPPYIHVPVTYHDIPTSAMPWNLQNCEFNHPLCL